MSSLKAINATVNSQRVKGRTFEYASVDGRVYQTEPQPPAMDTKRKTQYAGSGFPSLIEIYRITHFLSGRGPYYKTYIPPKERDSLIEEIGLQYDNAKGRYTASHETLWEYFCKKYPEKIAEERITSYGELEYRSRHRR